MKRRRRFVVAVIGALAAATVAHSGHELPVYPSYYPHEIEIVTVAPGQVAGLLRDGKIQAYVGGEPTFVGPVPGSIGAVESLGSFVIVRVNPLSRHARGDASACAAVRAVARAVAANGDVILHPYPVTPFHGDYLHHVDRVEDLATSLLGPRQAAPAIQDLKMRATGAVGKRIPHDDAATADAWDIEIEEVAASELVASTMTALNGWLGPPALKTGWYQAYLLLGDAVDGKTTEQVESELRRLQYGGRANGVEHINFERDLVAELIAGCRKVVIGYTVKREYYNADFSVGIENIAYDAHQGFNSPMFTAGVDTTSKTFRVGDVSFVRELLAVDVYLTIAPDYADPDAVAVTPWSTLPWHLLVLMEEAVSRGWAAFSQEEAARRSIEWLDLVRSDKLKRKLVPLLETLEREAYRPTPLQALMSADEARKRWSALLAFHREHGHFLVTNGPYQLMKWSPGSVTLVAFRDLTYLLGVGSYDAYAIPRRGYVTKVDRDGDRITLSGDIEVIEKFQRSYRLVRTPLPSVAPIVRNRAAPECRYVVVDDKDRVALAGVAPLGEDATFRIDIGGRLPAGQYTMRAIIVVNGNVMNPDIRLIPIAIASGR